MNTLFIPTFISSLVITTLAAESCHTEYKIIWNTQYIEMEGQECHTRDEQWCSEACEPHVSKDCEPHNEELCSWEKKTECKDVHKKIHVPYTETECKKKQKKICDHRWVGTGKDKIWEEIPGTCKFVYDDYCEDVTKHREKETTEQICEEVPQKYCHYVEIELCKTITMQKCKPYCTKKPKEYCEKVHKKVPVKVSKKIPHTVCTSGNNCNEHDKLGEGLENCFKNIDGQCCGDDLNTNQQVCRATDTVQHGGGPSGNKNMREENRSNFEQNEENTVAGTVTLRTP